MRRLILAMVVFAVATLMPQHLRKGILPLSNFRLESDGIDGSGKVVVEGKGDKDGHLVSLKVTAFGRDYLLPKDKVAQFSRLMANGVQISYEAGYAELVAARFMCNCKWADVEHAAEGSRHGDRKRQDRG